MLKTYSYLALYPTHRSMMSRCFNPKNARYHRYGGRGITVCQRWLDIETFCREIGRRPGGKSLDRKNNDLHYSCGKCEQCIANGWPKNVQWATPIEQGSNKSNNVWITIRGQRRTLAQWGRTLNLRPAMVSYWLKNGPPISWVLSQPVLRRYPHGKQEWFNAIRKHFKVDDKVAA